MAKFEFNKPINVGGKKLDVHKQISLGGKKIETKWLAGGVLLLLLIAVSLQLGLAPTKPISSGLKDLELDILSRIGIGLTVESKVEAAASIGSIAQSLERARGTIDSLNEKLEGGQGETDTGQSGLVGLSEGANTFFGFLITVGLLGILVMFLMEKRNTKLDFG